MSSCPCVEWWTLWYCVSNLIVLYILFLKANFTSNTIWESQTFHHDENSSELYSGGFSKSFGLQLTTFPRFFKQNCTTLNYTLHYITLPNIMFKYGITHKGEVSLKMRQCLKVSEGDIAGALSHNLKYHRKYFVLKGKSKNQVRLIALWY